MLCRHRFVASRKGYLDARVPEPRLRHFLQSSRPGAKRCAEWSSPFYGSGSA